MAEPLTLHVDGFYLSPYVFAAFVCLEEKGLPFEVRVVNLHDRAQKTPAFASLSTTSRVPVLEHGEFRVSESSAIVEYLEDTFPPPQHVAPASACRRSSRSSPRRSGGARACARGSSASAPRTFRTESARRSLSAGLSDLTFAGSRRARAQGGLRGSARDYLRRLRVGV